SCPNITLPLHDALPISTGWTHCATGSSPGTQQSSTRSDHRSTQVDHHRKEPHDGQRSTQGPQEGGREVRARAEATDRHVSDGQRSEEHTSELQSRENLV